MSTKYKYQANVTNPYPSKTYSGYLLSDLLPGRTRIGMPPHDDPTCKTRCPNSQNLDRNMLLRSMYHEIQIFFPRKAIQIYKSSVLPENFTSIGRMVVHFSIELWHFFLSPANSSLGSISNTRGFSLLLQHSH